MGAVMNVSNKNNSESPFLIFLWLSVVKRDTVESYSCTEGSSLNKQWARLVVILLNLRGL